MKALEPVRTGVVTSHGVPIHWDEYGGGDRTLLFVPPWQIAHSRVDPGALPAVPGVEYPRFVPDLYAHLAGCDLTVGQGRTDPEALAHAIADGLKRPVLYRDVETDGAWRAAAMMAALL